MPKNITLSPKNFVKKPIKKNLYQKPQFFTHLQFPKLIKILQFYNKKFIFRNKNYEYFVKFLLIF